MIDPGRCHAGIRRYAAPRGVSTQHKEEDT